LPLLVINSNDEVERGGEMSAMRVKGKKRKKILYKKGPN
jgi:hypothetical protein